MASQINKYAQNIAKARYATPSYRAPQRRATIDPSLFSGKTAAKGAPLASRPIEGGPALPSPQEYNPIIDAESGEDPNAPRVETQQPITQRGVDPRFMIQGGGPRLDFSGFFPERANPNYDPNKAIGGENVPYKPSGFFRSLLGDPSNRMNIEAQQAQGVEWKADAKAAKERAERKQDLEDEIALREKGPMERFKAEQKRLDDKAIRDEIERQNAIDLALIKEGNEDIFRDIDMARKEVAADQDRQLRERQVKVTEDLAKRPRYKTIQTEKGGATVIDEDTGKPIRTFHPPGVGNIKDPITGKDVIGMVPGRWEEYELPTVPKDLPTSPEVDRTTGAVPGVPPLDTKLPPGGGVRMGGRLPSPEATPMRAAAPSPIADASLLGRFKEAMPSLTFNQPSARGYAAPEMTEGDVAQQAMSQIAYPLRAATAEEFKGEYENPEFAARSMAGAPPFPRFRKPSAAEMSQARKAGDLIRKMYAE